jgi:NADP-dependent 3-hydroxy acid dehydrogenase YdfG
MGAPTVAEYRAAMATGAVGSLATAILSRLDALEATLLAAIRDIERMNHLDLNGGLREAVDRSMEEKNNAKSSGLERERV